MRIAGEGRYFKDKNGYFAWRLRVDGREITRKAKTQKELKAKVAVVLREVDDGAPPTEATVAQFFDDWLTTAVQPSRARKTFVGYESAVRLYIAPTIGGVRLRDLTFRDCQKCIRLADSRGLGGHTAAKIRTVLRRALGVAVRRGLIRSNPVDGTEPARIVAREVATPSPAEVAAIIAEATRTRELLTRPGEFAPAHRYGAVAVVLACTGLRISEALGLADDDAGDALNVRRQLEHDGDVWRFVPLKTRRSKRVVPLNDQARDALTAWRAVRDDDALRAGADWQKHGLLFTTRNGEPLHPRNVQRTFDAILSAAGLRHYGLHALRRAFGSTLAAQGVPIHVVAALMGHSDVKTTLTFYTTPFAEDSAKAIGGLRF
jgi:integrase